MEETGLVNAVKEYIINNPDKDSVDIVTHFKLRADITMRAIAVLEHEGRITHNHLYGTIYGYRALGYEAYKN